MTSSDAGNPPSEPVAPPKATPASSQPIRVIIKKEGPAAAPPPEEEHERVSPQTGLALGVVVLLAVVVAPKATAVLFSLSCALAVLHREIVAPHKALEEYARLVPEKVAALLARLGKADGRVILGLLLLAVAIIRAHRLVFGAAGATALITALFILDFLDRPATKVLGWISRHEEQWAAQLKPLAGQPAASHSLAILALLPPSYYISALALTPWMGPAWWGRAGVTGAMALLLGCWLVATLRWGTGSTEERERRLARRTMALSMLGLSLCCCGMGIVTVWELKLAFLTHWLKWNGLGLAVWPILGLWWWYRGYRSRDTTGQAAEAMTWRFSGLIALAGALGCYLCWRGLALEGLEWGQPASTPVYVMAVAVCFATLRLAVGLIRASPGASIPEWAAVQVAFVLSLLVVFFLGHLGGLWGLALAILPVVRIWQEVAATKGRGCEASNPATAGGPSKPG